MTQKEEDLYKDFTDEELKALQERFDKAVPISFRKDVKIKSKADVYTHLFGRNSITPHPTIYSKNNNYQCYAGAKRSVEDTYRVMKYYFPKTTLKEVYNWLEANKNKTYCGQVHKVVFKIDKTSSYGGTY